MALEVQIEKRLESLHLEVEFSASGAPLGLLGSSGAGKSMTLRAIAGLETPDRGRIVLHGRVLFDSQRGINVPARDRRVGLLFQHYALFPHLTVRQNISFGLRRLPANERAARVARQLSATHLDSLADRYPTSLSGGERQRVALARALAIEPEVLLLDEPFSALDTPLRAALERQLRETFSTYCGAAVFVSHNLEEVYRLCQDVVVLSGGAVAAQGPKEEIFRHPPSLEVARLTGCKNISRVQAMADGRFRALDWGSDGAADCVLRVNSSLAAPAVHVAIRAHHLRVCAHAAEPGENQFLCWLTAMNETPFRVTLDLKLARPPASAADFHLQAEVFKREWDSFRALPQPWQVELDADRLFLLPD